VPAPTTPAPTTPAGPTYEKPRLIRFSGFAPTTTGGAEEVAIANAIQRKFGIRVVIIPGATLITRFEPLRTGDADMSVGGTADQYQIAWGVEEYADEAEKWGPQRIRSILNKYYVTSGMSVPVNSDIQQVEDIRGKRYAYVRGYGSSSMWKATLLAHGIDIETGDVELKEYSSFSKAFNAVVEGEADVVTGSVTASYSIALESSPKGARAIPIRQPDEDPALWERLKAIKPFVEPQILNDVVGARGKDLPTVGFRSGTVALPICDPAVAYWICKGYAEAYDLYKDFSKRTATFTLERLADPSIFPYHEGSIAYFKEAGVWTKEKQEDTDNWLKLEEERIQQWEEETGRKYWLPL
jgi:TRAP transporter TAXI family solute receptor